MWTSWRSGLAVAVISPAVNRREAVDGTRVPASGADLDEGSGRRRCLAVGVISPAIDGAEVLETAGVLRAGADLDIVA